MRSKTGNKKKPMKKRIEGFFAVYQEIGKRVFSVKQFWSILPLTAILEIMGSSWLKNNLYKATE